MDRHNIIESGLVNMLEHKINVKYDKFFGNYAWEVHLTKYIDGQPVNVVIKKYATKEKAIENAIAIGQEFPDVKINVYTMKGKIHKTL